MVPRFSQSSPVGRFVQPSLDVDCLYLFIYLFLKEITLFPLLAAVAYIKVLLEPQQHKLYV